MTTTTETSSSAQKRVSLDGGGGGGDEQKNQVADTQGDEQSRKRCKHDGDVEKQAISPDSAKGTEPANVTQAEPDDDDDAGSVKSESTTSTNDPQAETDDDDEEEDASTPRTDKEEIIYIVSNRLWSDDFEVTEAALTLFCKLTMPDHSNKDDNLKIAFTRGAPVLIARVMSMNRTSYEIQKHGCIALTRLATKSSNSRQQVIVDIGGLKLCRRASVRYNHCPIVQRSVCTLIGYLLACPDTRQHAVTEGLPKVLQIMNRHKKDGSIQQAGCVALHCLVKQGQNPQLVGVKEAVDGGAIECIIRAMERFPKDANIQTYGCNFLSCLSKEYKELIIEAKGLVMIAEAGRIHKDNNSVLIAARQANQALFM